jgi:hypothetical protein
MPWSDNLHKNPYGFYKRGSILRAVLPVDVSLKVAVTEVNSRRIIGIRARCGLPLAHLYILEIVKLSASVLLAI